MEETRTCRTCGEIKPLEEGFYRVGVRDRKYYRYVCKTCWHQKVLKTRKKKYAADPEFHKRDLERKRTLQRATKYGLSVAEVREKIAAQGGCCKICKVQTDRLHIDHNHTTDQVRDMLCTNCNTALGSLREDEEIMKNMIRYVRRWAR